MKSLFQSKVEWSFFQTKSDINFILLYLTLQNKNRWTDWTNNGEHKTRLGSFQENVENFVNKTTFGWPDMKETWEEPNSLTLLCNEAHKLQIF